MQDFLKEWGPAIITAVAVLAIVALVAALTPSIQQGMQSVITNFSNSTNDAASQVTTAGSFLKLPGLF